MTFRTIDLLRTGALSLLVLVAAAAGSSAADDETGAAPGGSSFSHNYEGRLASMAVEDRILEIFKVRGYPIYYIEFENGSLQSQALDRVGIFVESDEYSGKILAPQLMKTLSPDSLFDGHDYATEDVARFYSYAARLAIRLNPMEKHLRELLIRLGLLSQDGQEYIATHRAALLAAVAGMDERYGKGTRRWLLDHEFRHGFYFVTLKSGVHEIWQRMLSDREKEMIAATLGMTARYNHHDPALMEREFHAMIFESRFEDDLRSLPSRKSDGSGKATTAEVAALLGKLPEIRRALLALEKRL